MMIRANIIKWQSGCRLFLIRSCLTLFILVAGFAGYGNTGSERIPDLQIAETEAEQFVWVKLNKTFSAMQNGEPGNYRYQEKNQIPALFRFAMEYVNSAEFIREYWIFRESNKPDPNKPDLVKQVKRQHFELSLRIIQRKLEAASAREQEKIRDQIQLVEDEIRKLDETGSSGKQWLNEFPESPMMLIKRIMARFLEESADVDFQAKVKYSKHNQIRFANQEYESRSPIWKLCFRAGIHSTQEWRTELFQMLKSMEDQSQQSFM